MLSAVTLDDATGTPVTLHNETTGNRNLNKAVGLIGIGPLRDSRRVRPQAHGAIDETRYEDGKLITLAGSVWGSTQAAAYTEWHTIADAMMDTLDTGPALLKWTEAASGTALQRYVKLADEVNPELAEGAALINYEAHFFAEDPRAYSQTLTTATGATLSAASGGLVFPMKFPIKFSASGGGTVNFTNAGNRDTPLTLRVFGQIAAPTIVNLDTGARITMTSTSSVANGDYLELDTQERSIKLNGTLSQTQFYDAANSSWFNCPANSTLHLQLIGASFDGTARLDVLGRSAYA